MSEAIMEVARWTPPDEAARERIRQDLESNLLVEAGAGSGKTTAMVGRMIELIRTGTARVEEIAAVTFTRKAAAELKERFQEKLETEYRRLSTGPADEEAEVRARISEALRDLDRCYVGTIHSFCARLLRERPLEAGVPPNFEEVFGPEEERLRAEAWSGFVDRLGSRPHSRLARRLAEVDLRPGQLRWLFRQLSDNPDVHFPAPAHPFPAHAEIDAVRRELGMLLERSQRLLPKEEPSPDWDSLQKKVRSLEFSRIYPGWSNDVAFLEVLGRSFRKNDVVQNRWGHSREKKQAVKELSQDWKAFSEEGSRADRLYASWLAYRYPIVLRFARAAAGVYAAERVRRGQLTFQDLLLLTARLLRERPDVRRELGLRYRRLLVDEFQDTDPLQAEVVFLLASDPESGNIWSDTVPRPGALFVVGDPKQSIYRFRRADIALYGQVKRRFREVGEVLELVANFRSTPPVERLVNRVFQGLLPEQESLHQAAFAPLRVAPSEREAQGVFTYLFDPDSGTASFSGGRIHGPESVLLASWIRERIDRGERRPGDFMILTRRKKGLAEYARALEERNVPVQVTGAGVGVEEELSDLVLLLKALCDPGNAVLTLAVLEGLFFGLSHEQLYAHVAGGGDFSFLRPQEADTPVGEALRELRDFWLLARRAPADVVVPQIVEKLGLLPFAAAGELGGTRAGALLYALDSLRVAALDGATSLIESVEVLEAALQQEEAEAPLFPGEGDVVRLMNLHKAKGLEAPVVILADPSKETDHGIDRHITRDATGRAVGYLLVQDDGGFSKQVIARPLEWPAREAEEQPFAREEEIRLLYVAATRARDELVVGRCSRTEGNCFWTRLYEPLRDPGIARELELVARPAAERERMRETGEALVRRTDELAGARAALRFPSYVAASVTRLAKGEESFVPAGEVAAGARGMSWGTAVHQALEAAGQGAAGEALRTACRDVLVEAGRVGADGEPTEVEELTALVESVRGSALWRRAVAAERRHHEIPFLVAFTGAEREALRPLLPLDTESPDADRLVEGVIDLAFREEDGWIIADYKTDTFASDAARAERTALYRRQVDLYALCWERLTGEPVVERQLFFTQGEAVVW